MDAKSRRASNWFVEVIAGRGFGFSAEAGFVSDAVFEIASEKKVCDRVIITLPIRISDRTRFRPLHRLPGLCAPMRK